MVSETDVVMAYRLIMGRDPENQQVVQGQAKHYQSLKDLRAGFMTSPEFHKIMQIPIASPEDAGVKVLNWPATSIDVDVPGPVLERMIKRIEGEFLYLGEREPHWSVVTEDRFKSENVAGNEEIFFETGEYPLIGLRLAAKRSGVDLSHFKSCFELGCGMGRSTVWLAREFPRVIGGDISRVHLDHARRSAKRFGLHNISFAHLNEMSRYQELPSFDVFFSIIVIQHNPPPLMAFLLETILNKLKPGGIAYFQIPTYIVNYSFSAEAYLDTDAPVGNVEVHCLPQSALFDIIDRTGCKVLEMREDGAVGALAISNRLLLRKRH